MSDSENNSDIEMETPTTNAAESQGDASAVAADESSNDLAEKLAAAEAKAGEHQEALLRVHAEMENLRKRNLRELENARRFALERFMGDLLEVRDSLERGLEAADQEQATVEQLREGKELTYRMLVKAMAGHGLVEIDPVGEKFDPERHEAMSMVPGTDHEPDTVVTVVQKGYLLNDRLIRPARVLVARSA